MPLYVANRTVLCQKLMDKSGVGRSADAQSITFTEMEEYLDSDVFESLPEPPARDKSIFFVELQRKSEVKLNTNDIATDYLSPTQCIILK